MSLFGKMARTSRQGDHPQDFVAITRGGGQLGMRLWPQPHTNLGPPLGAWLLSEEVMATAKQD